MIHGELFDLAVDRRPSVRPEPIRSRQETGGRANPPGLTAGHLHLVGSRNAVLRQHTPGQDRTGGGRTVVGIAASRHHGLRITQRGKQLRAGLLVLCAVMATFFVVLLIRQGIHNWHERGIACDSGRVQTVDCSIFGG